MLRAEAAEQHHHQPFCEGVPQACGSPDLVATNPISALNSQWKWVAYTKATLTVATAAWEGHRPASRKPPPPRQKPWAPSHFDLIFWGPAREEDNNQGWGDSWGYCSPTPRPTMLTDGSQPCKAHRAMQVPVVPEPVTAPVGPDMASLITTLLKAQLDAQVTQVNANHANLIAFQTATAQALAAKGGDKESKLTAVSGRSSISLRGHYLCRRV